MDDSEKSPEHDLVNKIEDRCRDLVGVYVLVHKVQSAVKGLAAGGNFWAAAVAKGITLYQADNFELPAPPAIDKKKDELQKSADWKRWGAQGKSFLKGAAYYLTIGDFKLALFLLHQATESTLIGLIKVLFGYRQSLHNLSKLLRLTLLFTDEPAKVFGLKEKDSAKVFALLANGYSEARYKEGFEVEEGMVRDAYKRVAHLLELSEAIALDQLNTSKQT